MHSSLRFFILANMLIFLATVTGCKKNDDKIKRFPTTPEEIKASLETTQRIAGESSAIANKAIQAAVEQGRELDPVAIAKSIKVIEGVISAVPTESGAGIIIQQDDSVYSNLILIAKDDERFFKAENIGTSPEALIKIENSKSTALVPNGNRKALLLLPFQDSFNTDIAAMRTYLESVGFSVEVARNNEVDLKKIKGNTLIQFDVIYISTHGLVGVTYNGITSTIVLSREEVDPNKFSTFPASELNSLATIYGIDGVPYYGVSVPWLKLTTEGSFTNSWIYIDACESAKVDNGPASLSEAFLKFGAGGYNGYDGETSYMLGNPVARIMFEKFTSGLSFKDASNAVRNDPDLPVIISALGNMFGNLDVRSFDDNQLTTDTFYLIEKHDKITDIDGNSYNIGSIGSQVWMLENFKATRYNDGNPINKIVWNVDQYEPGYALYNFDINYKNVYGAYYNFYAVKTSKLCPVGWHVPTFDEWMILRDYLIANGFNYDGSTTDNKIAKSLATATDWKLSLIPGTPGSTDYPNKRNSSGFTGKPEGGCFILGGTWNWGSEGEDALWWSSTESNENGAYFAELPYRWAGLTISSHLKTNAWSVRCLKDN